MEVELDALIVMYYSRHEFSTWSVVEKLYKFERLR